MDNNNNEYTVLSGNAIGYSGRILAEALKSNTTLTELNLAGKEKEKRKRNEKFLNETHGTYML